MIHFSSSLVTRYALIITQCLAFFACESHLSPDEPDTPETIYVCNNLGNLYAIDALSGAKKWEFQLDIPAFSSPTVADGVVYVGGGTKLYAFDAGTGSKKWDITLGDVDQLGWVASNPTVVNGLVYVSIAGYMNTLYAVDATRGTLKWKFVTKGLDINTPTVANGMAYLSIVGKIVALDAITGLEKWEVGNLQGRPTNSSLVNGVLYTNFTSKLYAHDAITGVQKWVSNTGGIGSITIENGLIFIKDAGLYVIDAATGKYVREYSFYWSDASSPVVVNGIVYVGSGGTHQADGTYSFHAIDALTARKKWILNTEFMTSTSPTVAAGTVFFGTSGLQSKLYAVDALTGVIKWAVAPTRFFVTYNPSCVVTKKGVVYHASDSGDQQ